MPNEVATGHASQYNAAQALHCQAPALVRA